MAPRKENNAVPPSSSLFARDWRINDYKDRSLGDGTSSFNVGDEVFCKPPGAKCVDRWRPGVVTGIQSSINVEVDGVPRHVSDLRLAGPPNRNTQ